MSDLNKSFQSSKSIRETHNVTTETDPATGIVTDEDWWKDDELDRADAPAAIMRDRQTGEVTDYAWFKNGERFNPTAEVLAAWLKKEAQENSERIARLATAKPYTGPSGFCGF